MRAHRPAHAPAAKHGRSVRQEACRRKPPASAIVSHPGARPSPCPLPLPRERVPPYGDVAGDRKFHGRKFRRQHPIGPYVADFFCAELGLVLEIDGAVHNNPEQQFHDRERTLVLQGLGFEVIRISNSQVESNPEQALTQALPSAQISLLPPRWEKGRG